MRRTTKGITQRGSKYRVSVGSGVNRVTTTVDTLDDAVNARTIMKAETFINRTAYTLKDAYVQTVRECWSRAKSGEHSAAVAQRVLQYFNPALLLTDITRTEIAEMEEHFRAQGNTNATINRKLSALSKMLNVAYEHGWLKALPVIHQHKEGVGRIRYFSVEEERTFLALLKEWGKTDAHDYLSVLLDTGMRPGELLALHKQDINFTQNLVHIWMNKTDHPRSIPMTRRVRDILFTRTVTHPKPFPYREKWLEHAWNRIRLIMGLEDDEQFVVYACRHTCATRLLQRGFSLPELQKWLGHKSLAMTMRYAHLSPTALLKGAALLEQEEVSHETHNSSHSVVTDSVRSGSMPGVRGAEHPPASTTERAVVQAMCATTPTRTLQPNGGQVGDGGPITQAGDAERANDAEPEFDVHVSKPSREAVLNKGGVQ
mgnify:CR=1 FL=1